MDTLSLLIKPASGSCNLKCKYCFYSDVSGKRQKQNRGFMSLATLETIIKKALSEAKRLCIFGFQGGEPTLIGLDFFKESVKLQKKYNINNTVIKNSIQTNGILINEDWAEFFFENEFLVGLSIDGYKEIHNLNRVGLNGEESFLKCMNAAKILKNAGADFNILTVLTKQLAKHPEKLYSFYKKAGFRYIQLIPCLDNFSDKRGANPYSLDQKVFASFYCRLFDLWYNDYINGEYYSIRTFDNYIRMLMGQQPENCAMAGFCQSYAAIEADGLVYPCDFYVLDEYLIGDIHKNSFKEILESEKSKEFAAPSLILNEKCKACGFISICRGGCRRDREPLNSENAINYYCGGYKEFFNYCLPRMDEIAKKLLLQNRGR